MKLVLQLRGKAGSKRSKKSTDESSRGEYQMGKIAQQLKEFEDDQPATYLPFMKATSEAS